VKKIKKFVTHKYSVFIAALLLLVTASTVIAKEFRGVSDSNGIPLYVIIEVDWDGVAEKADWKVWGPKWNPTVGTGTILTSCTNCLDANYDFRFAGTTVQFDEVFVNTVIATPQVKHIVLHDPDGDGTYTGSESAEHYFPWAPEADGEMAKLYFDRLDYVVTFDENRNLEHFHYTQYEHKKL
jgi:hypothetical protein